MNCKCGARLYIEGTRTTDNNHTIRERYCKKCHHYFYSREIPDDLYYDLIAKVRRSEKLPKA